MKRIVFAALSLTLLILVFGAGCSDSDDEGPSVTDEATSGADGGAPVTVGALLPLSGDLASYGETSQAALDEAVAALQAEGKRVTLSVKDTETEPATALEALTALHEAGVKLVIGPYASSQVRAVKEFADQNGIVLISPLSTSTALAVPDDNIYRFTPDDQQEGVAVANLAWADGIRTIVPISRDDEGNKGLQSSMKPVFEALGGTVAPLITYSTDAIAGASGNGPVAVYLTAFGEVTKLFGAAAGTPELESVKWYGSDSVALSKGLIEDETAAAFAVKADYPNPILGLRNADEPAWGPVSERLSERLGRTPDAFALAAYDALFVGVEALTAAGEDADAAALGQALTEAANAHTGLTGPTELNDAGDRSLGNYDFWAVCGDESGYEWVRVATYTAGVDGGAGEARRETGC